MRLALRQVRSQSSDVVALVDAVYGQTAAAAAAAADDCKQSEYGVEKSAGAARLST